ncbi:universal stress protein [Halovivax sp.]|uniref:universal stress protein n=1 Tax=Halovivax sp. TaxID=1935978 RepID=UPI0025C18F25|nr:universal stress protein [Halovivax sp.]
MDGSDVSTDALVLACETHPDAEISVIRVTDPTRADSYTLLTDAQSDGLNAASERPSERAAAVFAEAREADRGVPGSRGRDSPGQVLLGSVAELVARRASVPVMIVR